MEVNPMILYENCEIGELILLCRERDDAAFDEIVRRYTPMLRKVVAGFESAGLESSELFAEACVALHLAAQKFDLNQKEVTFGLFARICVRNRMVDLYRLAGNLPPVSDLEIEQVPDNESIERRLVERETFDRLLRSARELLSDYEYSVLLLHIQGYKTAAIAKALGRTAKSVDNAKSRLFRHLRAELSDSSEA
jgi:RNA polymerase sporulation-specific sigma factor